MIINIYIFPNNYLIIRQTQNYLLPLLHYFLKTSQYEENTLFHYTDIHICYRRGTKEQLQKVGTKVLRYFSLLGYIQFRMARTRYKLRRHIKPRET